MIPWRKERSVERRWAKVRDLLPAEDRTPIANALKLAAMQYRKDAEVQRAAGIERMADGFTAQAEQAELLADIIEP